MRAAAITVVALLLASCVATSPRPRTGLQWLFRAADLAHDAKRKDAGTVAREELCARSRQAAYHALNSSADPAVRERAVQIVLSTWELEGRWSACATWFRTEAGTLGFARLPTNIGMRVARCGLWSGDATLAATVLDVTEPPRQPRTRCEYHQFALLVRLHSGECDRARDEAALARGFCGAFREGQIVRIERRVTQAGESIRRCPRVAAPAP